MPVSFTVVGNTLDATIIDGNFGDLERYLREEVVGGDINFDQINRFIIRRYVSGRLVSVTSNAEQILNLWHQKAEQRDAHHEITYRALMNVQQHLNTVIAPSWVGDFAGNYQDRFTMELLGRPGPSFYWQHQEDGIVYASPDPARYSPDYCYSYWLTVPQTGIKFFVQEPCVMRVHSRMYYMGSFSAIQEYIQNGTVDPATGKAAWDGNYLTYGKQIAMRLALIVDSNPNLYDEWVNTNPNVLDPVTGAQAAYKSWHIFSEKSVHSPLVHREGISGDTTLEGGRYYNISCKYRGAGALGYIEEAAFVDGIYEYDKAPLPNFTGNHQPMLATPPWEVQWISTSLHVEFIYGYGQIVSDTSQIGVAP